MSEPEAGRFTTRDTTRDASKARAQRPGWFAALARDSDPDSPRGWEPLPLVAAILAAAAAVAMIASCFAKVVYVTTATASCEDLAGPSRAGDCVKTGADQHSIAFILLGLAVLALTLLAVTRGLALAAGAVAVVGLVALLIALIGDAPQTSRSGALATDFSAARAHAGAGLWLEIVGAALAIAASVVSAWWLRTRDVDLAAP